MKATMEIEVRDVESIPENKLNGVLLQLGILNDTGQDPVRDFAVAWKLATEKLTDFGHGFTLGVQVTDACNGYGKIEHWCMSQVIYTEWCTLCMMNPGHDSRHKWQRAWRNIAIASGFTPQIAICRSLIKSALAATDPENLK